MICKFCKAKSADKTGSHVFTSSLISKCINQPGKKGRDNELMFGFGQSGTVDSFIGPRILPEKIEEIKGSQMTQDEINANHNEVVYDHVFCTSCEKLFSVIESAFSPEIVKIRDGKLTSFSDPVLARIYFLIQVFRASSVKYNDWSLESEFEEKLRVALLDACSKIELKAELEPEHSILKVPMLVTFLQTNTDPTSNIIAVPHFKNPTAIFLCDFVIQVFENVENLVTHSIEIYNLNDKRKPQDFIQNSGLGLQTLSNCDRECLIDNFVRLDIAPQFVKSYQQKFILLCAQTGVLPTKNRISWFSKVLFEERPYLMSITQENFIEAFKSAIVNTF